MKRLMSDQSLSLEPGAVHLWLLGPEELDAFAQEGEPWLAAEELLRAEVFPRAAQRRSFIGRRAALRHLLGRYTGSSPESLPLEAAPSGKPYLAGDLDAPRFSLSASDGWMALALCDGQRVGLDMERILAGLDRRSIAHLFFDPLELRLLESAPPQEKDALFFRAWTRAEAWLKMTGAGLAGLEGLAFARPAELWMRDLSLPPGLAGALCLERAPSQVLWMAYAGSFEPDRAVEDQGLALAPLKLVEARHANPF